MLEELGMWGSSGWGRRRKVEVYIPLSMVINIAWSRELCNCKATSNTVTIALVKS